MLRDVRWGAASFFFWGGVIMGRSLDVNILFFGRVLVCTLDIPFVHKVYVFEISAESG